MRTIDNPAQLKLDLFTSQPVNAQSDNIPEVRYLHPQPVSSRNLKLADKLEKLAATMQKTIDSKLNPAIGQQKITARRSRIATGMRDRRANGWQSSSDGLKDSLSHIALVPVPRSLPVSITAKS